MRFSMSSLLAAAVVCMGMILTSCGDDRPTPAEPTPVRPTAPSVPMVAGSYVGTVAGWLTVQSTGELRHVGTYDGTMTVAQSGDRVTIDGHYEGGVFRFIPTTGTIDADGNYTADTLPSHESDACGETRKEWLDLRFTAEGAEFEGGYETDACGLARFEAEFERQ